MAAAGLPTSPPQILSTQAHTHTLLHNAHHLTQLTDVAYGPYELYIGYPAQLNLFNTTTFLPHTLALLRPLATQFAGNRTHSIETC